MNIGTKQANYANAVNLLRYDENSTDSELDIAEEGVSIAKQELDAIRACLSVGVNPAPIVEHYEAELVAWRRNMLGKQFRLYKSTQLIKEFKALDLQDALSLCKELSQPTCVDDYAYQWVGSSAYELMEAV